MPRSLVSLLLIFIAMLAREAGAAELVAHPSVARQQLTVNAARMIFTMRLVLWPDGKRVRVFVLGDSDPLHQEFVKQRLELYPRQLRRVWDRQLYSGFGAVPVEVGSVDEMLERVAGTPGAIGYLPQGYAMERVRVVHVE